MEILGGVAFWAALGAWIWMIRPGASKHQKTAEKLDRKRKCVLILLVLVLIPTTGHLMTLSPVWNGENPEHRNQYELITEAFLEGRLDFGYEVDPVLLEMENPYDYEAREAVGAEVHFDHAFYHGKYYMYFGVVPVFLAFMPFRLVTGSALVTWQATWFFTAVYLAGLAVLFCWLAKCFVPRMTFVVLMSLLLVFSLASTLYVTKYPSLYQTPVACGMMLEVWSLYFFFRAFYEEEKRGFRTGLAAVGSLLGALTFGCRPPLAMANLLVIPMGIHYLRNC